MPDGLTTAAEARELAEFLVSAEGMPYFGPGEETLGLARALLAALDENELREAEFLVDSATIERLEAENERLREALREIDDMPVDEPARNAWTREFQSITRRALSNKAER